MKSLSVGLRSFPNDKWTGFAYRESPHNSFMFQAPCLDFGQFAPFSHLSPVAFLSHFRKVQSPTHPVSSILKLATELQIDTVVGRCWLCEEVRDALDCAVAFGRLDGRLLALKEFGEVLEVRRAFRREPFAAARGVPNPVCDFSTGGRRFPRCLFRLIFVCLFLEEKKKCTTGRRVFGTYISLKALHLCLPQGSLSSLRSTRRSIDSFEKREETARASRLWRRAGATAGSRAAPRAARPRPTLRTTRSGQRPRRARGALARRTLRGRRRARRGLLWDNSGLWLWESPPHRYRPHNSHNSHSWHSPALWCARRARGPRCGPRRAAWLVGRRAPSAR